MATDSYFFIYLLVSGLMLWVWKGGRDKALPGVPWLRSWGGVVIFVVVALQVVYGLLDFGSGLLRDWIGNPDAFAVLRVALAYPPLAGFIVATDFLTTAWIYLLFAKLVLSEDSSESSYFGYSRATPA